MEDIRSLTALELDALREIANIGAGHAATALSTDACEEYRAALAGLRSLALVQREQRDHALLRALLELYGGRYERAKRQRSGLDFEDLELIARDLLAGDAGLREAYAGRFTHVLVDEFQDVNP